MSRSSPIVVSGAALLFIVLALVALSFGAPAVADAGGDVLSERTDDTVEQQAAATPENVSPSSPITFADDPTQSGTATADADGGVTTGIGLAAIEAEYNQALLDERLDAAESDAARRTELREQQDRIEHRVDALRSAERDAYTGLSAGDRDAAAVTDDIARINGVAGAYEDWIAHVEQRTDETDGIDVGDRLGMLVVDTAVLQSPVRDRLTDAAAGTDAAEPLYVTAGDDGLLIGTNIDDTYHRDALDSRLYQRDAAIEIDEVEALERVDEQYPWLTEFDNIEISRNFQTPSTSGGAYRINVRHPHGDLTAFVNTESGNTFAEHHQLDHELLPTTETINTTDEGLRLAVERTFPTGPVKVTLLDEASNEPLQGTIRIDGQPVGTTNDDGEHWIVDTPGESELSATVATNRIAVQLHDPVESDG